jgi:ABC-type amino acid transport substrate-binding protein
MSGPLAPNPTRASIAHRARRRLLRGSLCLVLLCALTAAAALAHGQGPRLRIGVYGQDPPKSFVNAFGELAGFDIDVARALCERIRAECELVPSDWAELMSGLEENRFTAVVASLSITEARRQQMGFTRPYYRSPGRFVAREGHLSAHDPERLTGLKIGVRRGTTFDHYVSDNYAETSEIHRYSTQPDALLDLVLGRIDVILGDHIALEENFLKLPQGQGFAFVGPPVADPRWFGDGNGVAVPLRNPGMLRTLDRAVADLQANGTLRRISERWFGYDVQDLTASLQSQTASAVE